MNFPILSSLILLPTIGALFLFFIKEKEDNNNTIKYANNFKLKNEGDISFVVMSMTKQMVHKCLWSK